MSVCRALYEPAFHAFWQTCTFSFARATYLQRFMNRRTPRQLGNIRYLHICTEPDFDKVMEWELYLQASRWEWHANPTTSIKHPWPPSTAPSLQLRNVHITFISPPVVTVSWMGFTHTWLYRVLELHKILASKTSVTVGRHRPISFLDDLRTFECRPSSMGPASDLDLYAVDPIYAEASTHWSFLQDAQWQLDGNYEISWPHIAPFFSHPSAFAEEPLEGYLAKLHEHRIEVERYLEGKR